MSRAKELMRTSFVASLWIMSLAACGSSPPPSSGSGPHATTGSGTDEPIVIDVPPAAAPGATVVGTDSCESDADCVPAACCHAVACVARANAPECGEAMCTTDCRSRTMDCGGGCLCQEGHCAARLWELEAPTVE